MLRMIHKECMLFSSRSLLLIAPKSALFSGIFTDNEIERLVNLFNRN